MIISIVLVVIAGMCSSVMDVSAVFFTTSKLKKLNPLFWDFQRSWVRKWKNGDKEQGEKFLGSSTLFVCFTDAWHLFKIILIICFSAAAVFYTPLFGYWDIAILVSAFCLPFELFYRFLKA